MRTTNAIERRFREVRRRTRPMGVFQDRTSMDRILFADPKNHLNFVVDHDAQVKYDIGHEKTRQGESASKARLSDGCRNLWHPNIPVYAVCGHLDVDCRGS